MDPPGCSKDPVLTQRSLRVYQRFLTDAATGLTFSPELSTHSYSQADFSQLFRPSIALRPAAKRGHYRPPPRLRHLRQPDVELKLPPLVQSVGRSPPRRRLQESCRRTQVTEVQPVHKAANENQNLLNASKPHRNLRRWRWTSPYTDNKTETTESVNRDRKEDQDQDQDQDQITRQQPGSHAHSWITARCLDLEGDCSWVIKRLLAQLFCCQDVQSDGLPHSEDQQPDVQLVVSLLVFLSGHTTLVRSMLAEHLNSLEWQNRLLACETLSSLRGPVNKDVVHKLIHLMCSDHSDQVRLAAAETLVKLGKVQDVQNQIRGKLEGELGLQDKMKALDLIVSLKLMTVKLLDSFVSCFKDEFTSVRKQACVTAASLQLKDETVVSRLLELMKNDPAREVRLSAITAVGASGLSSADVQETLLRCVQTEEDAELRLAAYQLLQGVAVPETKVQDVLLPHTEA